MNVALVCEKVTIKVRELENLIEKLCPNGVSYKKLKECTEMQRGTSATKNTLVAGNIPVISGGKEPAFYCNTSNRDGETITVAGSGAGAGYVQYWDMPIFVNDAFSVKGLDGVSTKYIYYAMTNLQESIYATKKGGGVPHVHISNIENFIIPVPPLEVQQEIVRILDQFTQLTAELTAELTARKKQHSFYLDNLLTFEGNVPVKKIGDITRIFSAARVHKNEWTAQGIPFFRSSDIVSFFNKVENPRGKAYISAELYEKLSKKSGKIQMDDILVTGGGTIGIPYIVPSDEPLYMKDADLICIQRSESFDSRFLYYYFLSTRFRNYLYSITHNATIAHYTIEQVSNTPIPLPPLPEQRRIVAILDRFDALCNDLTSGLPAEIAARQKQYEYYRDKLLTFPQKK